jgi:hypothetical protein
MQSGDFRLAVVIGKDNDAAALGIYGRVVGRGNRRPSLVRMVKGTNGVLCSSSRMRGIMLGFYRNAEATSRAEAKVEDG